MGIQDINSFLHKHEIPFLSSGKLTHLSGYRLAVDSCGWVYTYISTAYKKELANPDFSIDNEIDHERVFKILLTDFIDFILLLVNKNITPVFVWDGEHSIEKLETQNKRREDRLKRIELANSLREELLATHPLKRSIEDIEKWKKVYATSVNFPSEYFRLFRKFTEAVGLPSFLADDDGEKLCAQLNLAGKVVGVWSRDTDLYAFGAPTMITGLNEYEFDYIQTEDIRQGLNWDQEMLRDFCIMCGTDFNKRISQLGPARAFAMLKKYGSLDRAMRKENKPWESLEVDFCRQFFTLEPTCPFTDEQLNWNRQVFEEKICTFMREIGMKSLIRVLRTAFDQLVEPKDI